MPTQQDELESAIDILYANRNQYSTYKIQVINAMREYMKTSRSSNTVLTPDVLTTLNTIVSDINNYDFFFLNRSASPVCLNIFAPAFKEKIHFQLDMVITLFLATLMAIALRDENNAGRLYAGIFFCSILFVLAFLKSTFDLLTDEKNVKKLVQVKSIKDALMQFGPGDLIKTTVTSTINIPKDAYDVAHAHFKFFTQYTTSKQDQVLELQKKKGMELK